MTENAREFRSLVTLSIDTYKEFSRGFKAASTFNRIIGNVAVFYLLMYIIGILYIGEAYGFFAVVIIGSGILILSKIAWRGGGLQYKRMVSNNNGQVVKNQLTVSTAGIHAINTDTGNQATYSLDRVLSIVETDNLFILIIEYKQGLIVDKRTLEGGRREDFIKFIFANCPNLKKKKVRTDKHVKVRSALIIILLIIGLLASAFTMVTGRDDSWYYEVGVGKYNDRSFGEIAEVLTGLGFTCIDDEIVKSLDENWYRYDYSEDGENWDSEQYIDKTLLMLAEIGWGDYDYDSWEWTPSESGVYCFDMEVFDIECAYTDFLRGVSAASGGQLQFDNINEDLSEVDWDRGTGSRSVTFDFGGQTHIINTKEMNDWFDLTFADKVNDIIMEYGSGSRLWFTSNGWQEIFVFCGDEAWMEEFEEKTGCRLYDKLS